MYPTQSYMQKALKVLTLMSLMIINSTSVYSAEIEPIYSHSVKPQAEATLLIDVKIYSANSRCVQITWQSNLALPKKEFEFLPNTLDVEVANQNCAPLWLNSALTSTSSTTGTSSELIYYLVSGELHQPFTVELSWFQDGGYFSANANWPNFVLNYKARNISIGRQQNSEYHIIKIGGDQ